MGERESERVLLHIGFAEKLSPQYVRIIPISKSGHIEVLVLAYKLWKPPKCISEFSVSRR